MVQKKEQKVLVPTDSVFLGYVSRNKVFNFWPNLLFIKN